MVFPKKNLRFFSLSAICVVMGAALTVVCTGCKKRSFQQPFDEHPMQGDVLLVPPDRTAYTGAYLDFGDSEDQVTLEKIEAFEENVGKHQAIIASSSFWGQQTFPRRNLEIIARHGSIPLVYWSPWDHPYEENRGPDRFNLRAILAGTWDHYIDMWADGAKEFGRPLFVSWGLEMNGTWFPWSGYFYGGGSPEKPKDAGVSETSKTRGLHQFSGPEIYKRAYRYVVDRVRKRGANNILWVFHVNNSSQPGDTWNTVAQYYPGSHYVDWLGFSAYGVQLKNESWVTVRNAFHDSYEDLCALDPDKPVMLAEWGIADFPEAGSKAAWMAETFKVLSTQFPRIKAAVFWNERWQNKDNTFSNLRVTSSLEALNAYRAGVASPFWLAYPLFKAKK